MTGLLNYAQAAGRGRGVFSGWGKAHVDSVKKELYMAKTPRMVVDNPVDNVD
ncbi:MAG: hypothetical protein HPY71_15140 [Firmicutes bacterium]|nr:hypothetical protein [Bacillota bacterium]